MSNLKQNIKQMKNEVIEAELNTKINTVITMIGNTWIVMNDLDLT